MEIGEIDRCRICGNRNLIPVLDLGSQALSGRFPKADEMDPPKAPLKLFRCDDLTNPRSCGLLQLKHTVSADELYLHDYGYRSGINATMTNHLHEIAREIEEQINLETGDIILDIGSNDATLLKAYSRSDVKKMGIDPAARQFKKYYPSDIVVVEGFFNRDNFTRIFPSKRAKVITSIAMFYDLQNPMDFVRDIKKCLHPEGIWVMEQSYMPSMLEANAFDTICQEHLEYYSLRQIKWVMDENDMKIIDVSFSDTNGGSFRVTVGHKDSSYQENREKILQVLLKEKELGLDTQKPYEEFKERVEKIRTEFISFLNKEKEAGKKIYVYGASTKGNVLLQYFGIGSNHIMAAAERNPEKFGRRMPVTGIPIISEEEAKKSNPDHFIVLPWHFRKEFLEREKNYLEAGGNLIFPLPKFEIISRKEVETSNVLAS